MKNAEQLYYDMGDVLDAYHENELENDKADFLVAIENKDMEFINHVLSLLDEEVKEEKEIIDNIKYLVGI